MALFGTPHFEIVKIAYQKGMAEDVYVSLENGMTNTLKEFTDNPGLFDNPYYNKYREIRGGKACIRVKTKKYTDEKDGYCFRFALIVNNYSKEIYIRAPTLTSGLGKKISKRKVRKIKRKSSKSKSSKSKSSKSKL
jgi:hypothetical protein